MRIRSLLVVGAVALVGAACTPPAQPRPPLPTPYSGGTNPDLAPQAGTAAYTQPGPYAAGVTTVDIEPGRKAEVWYPAAPASAVGHTHDSYHIKQFLSPLLQFLVGPDIDPVFETTAFRDLPVSAGGPFPVVLFSHGAASYRLQSTFLTAHLASWGFVVVSPDYFERGLQSLLGEPPAGARPDTQVADFAITKVRSMSTDPGPFHGFAETNRFFPIGHSAGGGTSISLLSRPDVSFAIPMAAGANPDSGSVPAVLSDTSKSIMWMGGQNDNVAILPRVQSGFDYTAGPDSLVVIPGAGHNNAFSDICEIARDQGGIVTLAQNVGLPLPDFVVTLGRDGCVSPPNYLGPQVWPITRHFVTAALRYAAGLDAQPVGLGSSVVGQFNPAPATYLHRP
ncbi:MAG: hypothetical protein U0Q22_06675 [Acidimicrobiales bacterium]